MLAAQAAISIFSAARNSGAPDEVGLHIPNAYVYWRTGVFMAAADNPPLAHVLIGLPAKILGASYRLWSEDNLLCFRIPGILMGLALSLLVFLMTGRLFNKRAALAALVLCALSPNILAHATLATLDLPIALFIYLAIYILLAYTEHPSWLTLLALSLACAAAVATKIQGLFLLPLVGIVLLLHVRQFWRVLPRGKLWLAASLLIVPVTWLALHAVYSHNPLRSGQLLPRLFIMAVEAKLSEATRGSLLQPYIFGERPAGGGVWYYFPVTILLKTPLPTLLLLALGLARRQSRRVVVFVLLPVVLFLSLAMKSKVNIGLRHILIIYPWLFVLAGVGADRLWPGRRDTTSKSKSERPLLPNFARGTLLAVLAAAYIGQAVWIAPHHLSYFNVVAGGPSGGYRYLLDSNFDWGQNDNELRDYVSQQGAAFRINPDPDQPVGGRLLISANALFGLNYHGKGKPFEWLKGYSPVRRIAYTWFEYDVPPTVQSPTVEAKARAEPVVARHFWARHYRTRTGRCMLKIALELKALNASREALALARNMFFESRPNLLIFASGTIVTTFWKFGETSFRGDRYLEDRGSSPEVGPEPADRELIEALDVLGKRPQIADIHTACGKDLLFDGNDRDAVESLELAKRLGAPPVPAEVNLLLAWIRATSRDVAIFNGLAARRSMESVCVAEACTDPNALAVLAAVSAAEGHFEQASEYGRRVVAARARTAKWLGPIDAHLAAYAERRPFRRPPPPMAR